MSTKFFTNKNNNSLFNKFKGIFEFQNVYHFDALVGYLRASGYFKLRQFLNNVPEIRILVGINADELIAEAKRKGQLYLENPEKTKEEYLNFVAQDIANAPYTSNIEESIIQFIDDIISGKVKIRAYGQKNLHAKIYIFRPNLFNQHTSSSVITGSSNLTDSGLGTFDKANYEFNVLLNDYDDVKFATEEFEELWKDANELIPADITKLKSKTYLSEEKITPYDLFIKMLVEYFGDSVIRDKVGNLTLPDGYTNLQYQADAVVEGFHKLIKHNGFILADVVGLGKTVIATRVIKKYIDKNGYNTKVLVVYPNALEVNWKSTIKDFGIGNYVDFISNGSLHKIIDGDNINYKNPEDYDLIIVDEAHKFRTSNTNMYGLLELICKTPRATVGNDVDRRKKAMLITATPLNNKPEDIANQLYLFQDSRKSTLEGIPNLQSFFADKIEKYKKLYLIKDHQQLVAKVKEIYEPIREKIFSELVIRRTRADIKKISRYYEDVVAQGMTFPDVIGPNKIEYQFNDYQEEIFFETVESIIDGLGYYRYRAIEFIDPKYADLYDNATLISQQLSVIMKTQLVKRLESSFQAFKKSLYRFYISNQRMIEMFKNDKIFIAPDIDVNKFLDDGREEDLEAKIEALNIESPNNQIFKAKDFSKELIEGLKRDQDILNELFEKWENIGEDPKTKKFIEQINSSFFDDRNVEKKLVIFSESKETVEYIAEELRKTGRNDVLAISAANNRQKFGTIRKNFDANYPDKHENNYNIIITTEVLAEGINLHRSNLILNYDIPWNATKLMQRIGRVNRIGTKAKEIFVYNFFPTAQSNNLIKLNEKALKKLQGFHSAFSEDSKVYSEEEQLIENTLGNLEPQEEVDERLQYLEMVRELYENNFKEYKRIKNLPAKSRVGRLAKIKESEAKEIVGEKLDNAILCYLRNKIKEGFYVANQKNCVEITFYQAVKLFEATKKEKPAKLVENHYDAVNKAIEQFKKVYNTVYSVDEYDTSNLSVQERNSVLFLNGFKDLKKNFPNELSDDFIELIDASLRIIYMGVFRKFRNEIATLAAKQKKKKMPLEKIVSEINQIINRYPIQKIARLDALRAEEENKPKIFEEPQIVITETFA
ncbi:DEAD/DEAH box helicase family protein [Elizabethkingia anophelis]|uniref:helicase-related protein n=1 Tax=Elizabethkingia anophelis TaxID=1117645 RepID=UPI0021A9088D|nr:DEAD/DEAH box helicase family protein [Elizabethkingia anophelis]MCT3682264.1 DEAD/DEAH box helicase family protein [Elizabethkingia anophelis]MCT3771467.1 DEAD/DEAH box helicase family protein [Elizabethkingia anophelis]MCT3781721.1 DEAD/DEAH box helicase family protein [Elizabethkingia anophelis]